MRLVRLIFVSALLILSTTSYSSSQSQLIDFSYINFFKGNIQTFTQAPKTVGIGMISGTSEKRDAIFSIIKILTIAGNSRLIPSEGSTEDFIGVFFDDNVIGNDGINFDKLARFNSDYVLMNTLKTAFESGKSCAIASIFNSEMQFVRGFIVANNDTSEQDLMHCALRVGGYLYGIDVAQSKTDYEFGSRLYSIYKMIVARTTCLERGSNAVGCAYELLGRKE